MTDRRLAAEGCSPPAHQDRQRPLAAAAEGQLKVFILAGQSNMEGAGQIKANPDRNGGQGSLEHLVKDPKSAERFRGLVEDSGEWVVRKR